MEDYNKRLKEVEEKALSNMDEMNLMKIKSKRDEELIKQAQLELDNTMKSNADLLTTNSDLLTKVLR